MENYSALLDTETKVDGKSMAWIFTDSGDPGACAKEFNHALRGDSGHNMHAFTTWRLFFRRDSANTTCAERWAKAGFPGLDNDERVLLQHKMQVRVVLMEVHRILDDQRLEGVDLLAPDSPPITFVDRNLAARATRFTTLLGWAYPLPHFWRMSGTATAMPEFGDFEAAQVVTEIVQHMGGPTENAARRLWLAEHFVRVIDAMTATARERHRLMIAGTDVQIGKAVYQLQAPFADCRALLDTEPSVEPDVLADEERAEGFAEARDWFDEEPALIDGRRLLGRVLLGQSFWRVEATSAGRYDVLRARFEKRLGKKVKLDRERRDDLATQMASEMPKPDPALVPPRLVQKPVEVEVSTSSVITPFEHATQEDLEFHFIREHLRDYADKPIPALNGKTPREATQDPTLRRQLLMLAKELVKRVDELNLKYGRTEDANGLLRELALTEIDFPPPPRRAPPPAQEDEDGGGDDYDDNLEPDEDESLRPLAPVPPTFTDVEEIGRLISGIMDHFGTAAEAIDEIEDSGSTVLDDVSTLTEDVMSDGEYNFLVTFVMQAWFALVPPGTSAPALDFNAMDEGLIEALAEIPSWIAVGPDEVVQRLCARCRQPALLAFLVAEMIESRPRAPKEMRPPVAQMAPMSAILMTVINEVDTALRS